jgi:hypothetical protein
MLTFFCIVGGIGLLLTLFSLFGIGGDHDFDQEFDHSFDHGADSDSDSQSNPGPSLFSYRVMVSFMAAFGVGGALTYKLAEANPFLSVISGLVVGVIVALVVWGLLKVAFSQQASSLIGDKDFIGMDGVVTIPIYSNQIGEISVVAGGQKKILMATVDTGDCKEGAFVKIKKINSGVALVELINKN